MDRPTLHALIGPPEHPELVFRRTYATGAADLRDALTRPDRLAAWFGRIDGAPSQVGDPFVATLSDDLADVAHGRVLACEERRIQVSWSWQGEPESVITARLAPHGKESTVLTLHHALADPDNGPGYGGGWEQVLQALSRAVIGPDPDAPADDVLEREAAELWRRMTTRAMTLTHRVPAPVDDVWQALTTTDGLRRWWWNHWTDVEIDADAALDGSYRIAAPSAGIVLEGRYLAVEPPGRLALTWCWIDEDGRSQDEAVEITLRPVVSGTATELVVRHTGPWTDEDAAENYRVGWEQTLGALNGALGAGSDA